MKCTNGKGQVMGMGMQLVAAAGLVMSVMPAWAQVEDTGLPAEISFVENGDTDNPVNKEAASATARVVDANMAWTPIEDGDDALLAKLASRRYPLSTQQTPNWYYYFKTRVAMQLDHSRLAVKVDGNLQGDQQALAARLVAAAQQAGVVIRSGGKAGFGWQFVTLERPLADAAAANAMIEDLTKLAEFAFVTPVFMSDDVEGGFLFFADKVLAMANKREDTKGVVAMAIGFVSISLFMMVYYAKSGVVAVVTLILNAIIMMACLSFFGATLTLPGLAGLALTIGMAVDSNVIIFERIRDEIRNGAGRDVAVSSGFDKAFSAIFDANVTTLLAGVLLYYFGTGAIRGFAVTLSIGVITTVFCAVFVARLFFDYFELKGKQGLSI
jgi:preprotein translocase subunit SecF